MVQGSPSSASGKEGNVQRTWNVPSPLGLQRRPQAQPTARTVLLGSTQMLLAQSAQPTARTVLLASTQVLLAQPTARTVLLASIRVLLAQSVQPTARTVLLASTQMPLAQPVQPTARIKVQMLWLQLKQQPVVL